MKSRVALSETVLTLRELWQTETAPLGPDVEADSFFSQQAHKTRLD